MTRAHGLARRKPNFGLGAALFLAFWAATAWAQSPSDPANTNANAKARAVLKYFQTLDAVSPSKGIVTGQFAGFGAGASLRGMDRVHEVTGQWPAIMGVDYAGFGENNLTTTAPNRAAREWASQGGLVTISAHFYDPSNGRKNYGLRDKDVNLSILFNPGPVHDAWSPRTGRRRRRFDRA